MRRNASKLVLLFLLFSVLQSAIRIQPARADSTTIYINTDGSITPPSTPISTPDNVTYTFTQDIVNESIIIERNNIVLDGNGYKLQGDGNGTGLELSVVQNVTVQNMQITTFDDGIRLSSCSNDSILGNNVTACEQYGIHLQFSSDETSPAGNKLVDNKMTDNGYNLEVYGSSPLEFVNDIDSSNTVNDRPVYYWVDKQDMAVPLDAGYVSLVNCSGMTVQGLTISHNGQGILVASTRNSTIIENNVTQNYNGIWLFSSSNNTVSGNEVANNDNGIFLGPFNDALARYGNSSDNTISWNNIAANNGSGIVLQGEDSSGNNVFANNITRNRFGILVSATTNFNVIYHNNFVDNDYQALDESYFRSVAVDSWDQSYPSGGNYWSDYVGLDACSGPHQNESGSDGIGDSAYVIDGENRDNYPLTVPYASNLPLAFPTANFVCESIEPVAGQPVVFNASMSACLNGSISSYAWVFGDGTSGTGLTVSHVYGAYGSYNISLTVVSSTFIPDTKIQSIYVRQAPTASYSLSSSPAVGYSVTFDASTSNPRGGSITSYLWNFGDQNLTSTTSPIVGHVYSQLGEFNVSLTVVDSEGLNASSSQLVTVRMPIYLTISTDASSTFLGFVVNIKGTLSDFYGENLKGEQVLFWYTYLGVQSWFPISSASTDNSGQYHIQWVPSATGLFTIKAEWSGNATYFGAASNVTFSCLAYQNQYVFSVESNSTVSDLTFDTNSHRLSFGVSGENGTRGYTRVTIAKSLIADASKLKVRIDGTAYNYTLTDTNDSWVLLFTYDHSIHDVEVDLKEAFVPEFSSIVILLLFAIMALAAIISHKRLRKTMKAREWERASALMKGK